MIVARRRSLLALLALATACGPAGAGAHRSVLIVTLDTVRRDAVGFHGCTPSPTPVLDTLAREAVVFEDAYTVSPVTLPAHASLLTGLYPASHGVRDNRATRVPHTARTLAEILHARGYRTGAAVAAFVLDECFGLDQGFERYTAPLRMMQSTVDMPTIRADGMVDRALEDLGELARAGGRFLYWLHLYDAHAPYDAPGTAPEAGDRERYAGEIAFADRELGRLFGGLRRLGVWDELVVIVASDHGEGLGDGPELTHGYFVYDPTTRIPLLLRHPDLAPQRYAGQVSLVDVVPTLLDLLDVDPGGAFDGVDLAPALRRKDAAADGRVVAIECYAPYVAHGWAPFEGVVRGPLKYLRSHANELYDRAEDPGELRNLYRADDPLVRELEAQLDVVFRNPARRLERSVVHLDSADRERLAALGYLGDDETRSEDDPPDFAALPDTHEKAEIGERLWALGELLAAGRLDEALVELRTLAALDPENPEVLERLAEVLLSDPEAASRNVDEVERLMLKVLAKRPGRMKVHWILARCAHVRAEQARRRLGDVDLRTVMEQEAAARASGRSGGYPGDEWRAETERSIRELRTVLELEHNHPGALSALTGSLIEEAHVFGRVGRTDLARQHLTEAIDILDRILAAYPRDDPAWSAKNQLRELARSMLEQLPGAE